MRFTLHHVPWLALFLLPLVVAYKGWGIIATLIALAAIVLARQAILVYSIPKCALRIFFL